MTLPGSLLRNKSVPQDGHAIELRLYAEDPQKNFLPDSGKLRELHLPTPNEHVRIDSGVVEGDTVTIFYDPMIAKLIVWDRTRADALQRMREALAQCDIVGPKSNIEFLERLVRHPAVVEGRIDTGYLDRHLDEFLPAADAKEIAPLFAAADRRAARRCAQPPPRRRTIRIRRGRHATRGASAIPAPRHRCFSTTANASKSIAQPETPEPTTCRSATTRCAVIHAKRNADLVERRIQRRVAGDSARNVVRRARAVARWRSAPGAAARRRVRIREIDAAQQRSRRRTDAGTHRRRARESRR